MYKLRLMLYERIKMTPSDKNGIEITLDKDKIHCIEWPENGLEENNYKLEEYAQEKSGAEDPIKLNGEEWNGVLEKKIEITSKNPFEVTILRERVQFGEDKPIENFYSVSSTQEENPEYISVSDLEGNAETESKNLEEKILETKINRPIFGLIEGGKKKS